VGRRIQGLAIVLSLCFLLVLLQLVNVQVLRAPSLDTNPYNPRVALNSLQQTRGSILAADGSVLATSVPATSGVRKYQRVYPYGPLFSHVVGINSTLYGNYGLEGSYDRYLRTHSLAPQSLAQLLVPKVGTDAISTTLVPSLQKLAASQLAGRAGAVVVLDPRSGDVLAMFSNPSYNPNLLVSPNLAVERAAWSAYTCTRCHAHGFAPLTSLAYQYSFAPGSTSKVLTSAAVYDLQPALANTYYPYTTTISLPGTTATLHNFGYGSCGGTLAMMLPPSCDTGFAELGLDLGGPKLAAQANAFGYNAVPPLDVPGVASSTFPTAAQFRHNQPGPAYAAIGQEDVSATALQNAMVAATIADGGTLMGPHLVTQIRDQDGNLVFRNQPTPWRRPTTKAAAAQINQLMQQVVTSGTAAGVFNPAIDAAAKTGTAQVGYPVVTNTHDWMIAFAPATKPTIAIAVVLPYQEISATGAEVAGPVANCLLEGALAYQAHLPVTGTSSTCPA